MWKFPPKIDTLINLTLIVVGFVTLAIIIRGCTTKPEQVYLTAGQEVGDLFDINKSENQKSVIIILDSDDPEISQNTPFYKYLTQSQEFSSSFKTKILFKNDSDSASKFLSKEHWKTENESSLDPIRYRIQFLPTLFVVSADGSIEKMYEGIITSSKQVEIKELLSIANEEMKRLTPLPKAKPYEIYKENNPIAEILLPEKVLETGSGAKFQSLSYKQINDFALDGDENITAIYQEHILKINKSGVVTNKTKLNSEFHGGFAVGLSGKSYLFLKSRKVLILNEALENYQLLDLADSVNEGEVCVKMSIDHNEGNLYFQTYDTSNRRQSLYKTNLQSKEIELLFFIENTPYTLASFGPGIFDWAISKDKLFISDISSYQIDVFSLKDNKKIDSVNESARINPINPKDSEIKSLGLDLPHILKPDALVNYPAIWAISVTPMGKLIVFSSERDREFRQVINIYDKDLNKIGTDYKYFRPTKNNFVFFDDLVYTVDCGPGSNTLDSDLTPLDTPSLSGKINVFRSLL